MKVIDHKFKNGSKYHSEIWEENDGPCKPALLTFKDKNGYTEVELCPGCKQIWIKSTHKKWHIKKVNGHKK